MFSQQTFYGLRTWYEWLYCKLVMPFLFIIEYEIIFWIWGVPMIPIFSLMPGLRFEPHFSFYYLFSSNIFMCVCVKVVQVIVQYSTIWCLRFEPISLYTATKYLGEKWIWTLWAFYRLKQCWLLRRKCLVLDGNN